MLNNFYILPSVQHPIIEPFLNCVMVSDGSVERPDGFDFERDGDLVSELLKMDKLEHGQRLFYVRKEGYYEIVFNDCGVIMCLVPWTHTKGATINPPSPPLPTPDKLTTWVRENAIAFRHAVDGKNVVTLYMEPGGASGEWTREKRDELTAELSRRWNLVRKLLAVEMPQGEPIISHSQWVHGMLKVLTEAGYMHEKEGE